MFLAKDNNFGKRSGKKNEENLGGFFWAYLLLLNFSYSTLTC